MDLNAARMFVYVVTKGSFSAAAIAMGVPVATVSRRIAELEKQLELRLLERSTRKLRLTEAGSTLYKYVARGVEECDAGLLAIHEQQHELKGTVRFSMPPSFEPMWQVIETFQQKYSNVTIEVLVTERKVDFIADGIDVALRVGNVENESAIARKLTQYRHKIVATPAFKHNNPIDTPHDLTRFKCVTWGRLHSPITWRVGDEKITLSPNLIVNDYLHVRTLALTGRYFTELPPFFCNTFIEQGQLVELLPKHPLPIQPIHLLYPSRKHVSRISREFIEHCIDAFSESP